VRTYATVLGVLALAFLGRVLGQFVVVTFGPELLPPMDEWQSGLLPYPVLLLSQIAILGLQFEVSRQLWIGRGALARPRPRLGAALKWFSLVYLLAMVARYAISMSVYPERRWFGDTIPIFFHCVLASYLYVLSRWHRNAGRQAG
jgi:hypothetical protein